MYSKFIYTFTLSLLIVHGVFCQGFEKHYTCQLSSSIGSILELPDSNYILIVNRYYNSWFQNPYDVMVYKISKDGSFIDSLEINRPDSALSYCLNSYIVNSEIIAFATILDSITMQGKGYMFSFDFNLGFLWGKTINLRNDWTITQSTYKETDSTFYLTGQYITNDISSSGFFITKIDNHGNILDSLSKTENAGLHYLLYIPLNNNFHLISSHNIRIISKDLQHDSIIWVVTFPSSMFYEASGLMISDSTYLTVGQGYGQYIGGVAFDNCLINRKIDSTVLSVIPFGAIDTNDQPGNWSLCMNNLDSIYFICQSNAGHTPDLWSNPVDVWMSLYNIKSDGNINWYKMYGDSACYRFPRIIKTMDNGCLIACERWDWRHLYPTYFSDIYIIKIDKNGNSTSTGISKITENSLFYISNTQSTLVVNYYSSAKNSEINICDITGRLVSSESLHQGTSNFSISGYTSGMYIISLFECGRKTMSRKFIVP